MHLLYQIHARAGLPSSVRSFAPFLSFQFYGLKLSLIRRLYRYSLFEDCLRVDVNTLPVVTPSSNVKRKSSIHNRHGRKKRLAVTQWTKDRATIRLKEVCHVEALDMSCSEIAVHFAPNSWLYHADVMNHRHLLSVNRPLNPLRLLALPRKIPIHKQLFRVRDTPTKNTVQQYARQRTFYDNSITD